MPKPAFIIALILLTLSTAVFAQNAIVQTGPTSPYDLGIFAKDHVLQSATNAVAKQSRGTNPFSILDSLGKGLTISSAPTNGPNYSLILGHDASGNATIDAEAFNGAAATGLNVIINGTTYPFPGAGNGNALLPTSPAVGAGDLILGNGSTNLADVATKGVAYFSTVPTYSFASGILGVGLAYSPTGTDPSTFFHIDVPLGDQFDMFRTQVVNNGLGQLNGWHLEMECGANTGSAAIDCVQGFVVGGQNFGAGTMKALRSGVTGQPGSTGILIPLAISVEPVLGQGPTTAIQIEQNAGTTTTAPYGGIATMIQNFSAGVQLATAAGGTSGTNTLTFSSVPLSVQVGNTISGPSTQSGSSITPTYYPSGTIVTAVTSTQVTLSNNALTNVPVPTTFTFSPAWLDGFVAGNDIAVTDAWLHTSMDPSFGPNARVLRINGLVQNGSPILAEIDNQVRFRTATGYWVGPNFSNASFRYDQSTGSMLDGGQNGSNLTIQSGNGTGTLTVSYGSSGTASLGARGNTANIVMLPTGTEFPLISTTPGGKQPLCIDISTKLIYQGSAGAC